RPPEANGYAIDAYRPASGELFALEWRDVDLGRAVLTVRAAESKNRKVRHVPLNSEALNTLRRWKLQTKGNGFVFTNAKGRPFDNVKTALSRLLAEAKITNFRWHDFRHHFASKLVMAGVDLNTVREPLGHADIKMT